MRICRSITLRSHEYMFPQIHVSTNTRLHVQHDPMFYPNSRIMSGLFAQIPNRTQGEREEVILHKLGEGLQFQAGMTDDSGTEGFK